MQCWAICRCGPLCVGWRIGGGETLFTFGPQQGCGNVKGCACSVLEACSGVKSCAAYLPHTKSLLNLIYFPSSITTHMAVQAAGLLFSCAADLRPYLPHIRGGAHAWLVQQLLAAAQLPGGGGGGGSLGTASATPEAAAPAAAPPPPPPQAPAQPQPSTPLQQECAPQGPFVGAVPQSCAARAGTPASAPAPRTHRRGGSTVTRMAGGCPRGWCLRLIRQRACSGSSPPSSAGNQWCRVCHLDSYNHKFWKRI